MKSHREDASSGTGPPRESVPCPLCGTETTQLRFTLPDRLHGLPGLFSIGRCDGCGLIRQDPRVVPDVIGSYYPDDYKVHRRARTTEMGTGRTYTLRRRWVTWRVAGRPGPFRMGIGRWVRTLPARLFGLLPQARFNPLAFEGDGRKLLDVGAASGDLLAAMEARGWDAEGIELSEQAVALADERDLSVVAGSFPESANELEGPYDAITMREYIEHASDPVGALRAARDLLAPSGLLLITTPLADSLLARLAGRHWFHLDPPRHYQIFTRRLLVDALRRAGLRPVMAVCHSSTDSWTRSWGYFRGDGPKRRVARNLEDRGWLRRLLRGWVYVLDLFGRGDGGVVLAVRDDAAFDPRQVD